MLCVKGTATGEQGGPPKDISEFPDVPGPRLSDEDPEGFLSYERSPLGTGSRTEESVDDKRNLGPAFP